LFGRVFVPWLFNLRKNTSLAMRKRALLLVCSVCTTQEVGVQCAIRHTADNAQQTGQQPVRPITAIAALLLRCSMPAGWQVSGAARTCICLKTRIGNRDRSCSADLTRRIARPGAEVSEVAGRRLEPVRRHSPVQRMRRSGSAPMMVEIANVLGPAVILLAVTLLFNLHYVVLGRPFLEGLLTSRPVVALSNKLTAIGVKYQASKAGVPQANRTETYRFGASQGKVDIYEPQEGSAEADGPRPAVLYFHSGGFLFGDRILGVGVCAWLASHGALCLSASYRVTNSGAGVAGCIEDAWAVLRWTRSNAGRLNIDPSRIIVAGDSAGGLLATALATGLDPKSREPIDGSELPAAVVASWPATCLESRRFAPLRSENGTWEPTPAGKDFLVPSAFVPPEYRDTASTTQARLRTVLAGGLLGFGRRAFGLLPATEAEQWPADDGASVSPLRLADRAGLPPILLLSGAADQIVPCTQTSQFAETAQAAGNEVAQLIFEDAIHGGGAVNCATGRRAALTFLRHHKLLQGPEKDEDDPRDAIGGLLRALNQRAIEYEPLQFRPAEHGRATLRVRPVS